jgi:hypothetical protein
MTIFVNSKYKENIKDLYVDTITRGLLGIGGNKGGISIRFK